MRNNRELWSAYAAAVMIVAGFMLGGALLGMCSGCTTVSVCTETYSCDGVDRVTTVDSADPDKTVADFLGVCQAEAIFDGCASYSCDVSCK